MIKENVKLKNSLTIDYAKIIESICDYIISKDGDGTVTYIPYIKDYAVTVVFAKNIIEGITFEDGEDIYESVMNDEEVRSLLINALDSEDINIAKILETVDDIVEFRKHDYLRDTSVNKKLLEILNNQKKLDELNLKIALKQSKLLDQQIKANEYQEKVMENMSPEESAALNKKLLSGEYDINKMTDIVVQKYIDSELHKGKQDVLIAEQQNKIADLSKYKAMHDARNTLADFTVKN